MQNATQKPLDLEAIRERLKRSQDYIDTFPRGEDQGHRDMAALLAEVDRFRAALAWVRKERTAREKSEYGVVFDAGYETALDNVLAEMEAAVRA